ncbi:DUF3375 family protein [Propionibacterium australiense]|uniref:DUF3375 family protein n=1 Tax=Propionibacterium australiense TaxID=119981 RepID=A0A383S844_9ACTN|nr:DUF3375 family protein [Propionibacterium australiense]RLP09677.1 DUF3375 family protein [Propionibacterium australiense]RLP12379.1 DUF3375 family protein [Propionibacterium australiense]SYZ33584.1 Protein of unknown function DUF3375 [Propionibacterium australiense]VEH89525.1 Protein of uncharacterised function (DUF3375) [Propionibacterium australiense]
MASDIRADVARVESALDTPTLKLLDRKSASIALPVFASLFPENADPIPTERFHTRVDALLDELRASGYDVPLSSGKQLASQWVRERWLYHDPGREDETYRLTSDAEQALDYVTRATRTTLNVSASRIETMRRVVAEAALAAHPDREKRMSYLHGEITRLTAEYERLQAGGELQPVSDDELAEQFANVLRELEGLPADFRRVEEAVRAVHRDVAQRFRNEDRPVREVIDYYLDQSQQLLTATPEGRAFSGALQLLREPDWLRRLRDDLGTILEHPLADALLPEENRQLRGTVEVLRRGIDSVLAQRHRATATLSEHIQNYDHVRNRELDLVLRGIDEQLRGWMQHARARDHVDVGLLPAPLEIDALKLNTFDPDSEKPPEPLEDVSDLIPAPPDLDDIRKQGGPRLDDLRGRIREQLHSDALDSAAHLFNTLPDDLKRPVEVLGMLHLLAEMGADIDLAAREPVRTIRPDGTTRTLAMPRTRLTAPENRGDDDD